MATLNLPELLLRRARVTTNIFRVFAVISVVVMLGTCGAGVFAPAKRGELGAKVAVVLMGVAMGVGGVASAIVMQRRGERTYDLAINRPQEITKLEIVCIKNRSIKNWAVWMTDSRGKRLGSAVANEDEARQVVAQLREAGARG